MVLIWFEAMLGLKINLGKYKLVIEGAAHNIELLVAVLGWKQGSLRLKYLGLLWGGKEIKGLKKLYLSRGDKVTLIKSTLSNLHIFFLYFLSLILWLTKLQDFNETFYGVA